MGSNPTPSAMPGSSQAFTTVPLDVRPNPDPTHYPKWGAIAAILFLVVFYAGTLWNPAIAEFRAKL